MVPFISYKTFKSTIKEEVFNHLITARELLRFQVENYFHERFGDVDVLGRNPIIAQSFVQLANTVKTSGVSSSQYSTIAKLYQPLMEHYVSDYGYVNIMFADNEGNIVYSTEESEYIGENVVDGEYKGFSISNVFAKGQEGVAFEDYTWHEEIKHFTSFFSAPIYDGKDKLGVIIIELPFTQMDIMLTHRAGLGETGEMYLVGDDGFMRSNSRFSEHATIMQKEVETDATLDAFNGNTGAKIVEDYRGVSVLSAYTPLDLKFVDWVLIVEIDVKEAFASIRFVEIWLIVIGSILAGISGGYVYLTNKMEKYHEIPPSARRHHQNAHRLDDDDEESEEEEEEEDDEDEDEEDEDEDEDDANDDDDNENNGDEEENEDEDDANEGSEEDNDGNDKSKK